MIKDCKSDRMEFLFSTSLVLGTLYILEIASAR
jgi:hypothetical protein